MKDFSKELTVFLITCGDNPNLNDCYSALLDQTCLFKIDTIKNYTPMSVAFQQMLERINTPYYIEVDEDMILEKNTIEKMYTDMINEKNPAIAMKCYFLHDVHLDKDIMGVKIYKSEIFKKYPYNMNHPSIEVEQLERLQKDGYIYEGRPNIVGLHSPKWTADLIYARYYNLSQKYRLYSYNWMGEPLKTRLIHLDKNHPSELNHNALLGYLNGLKDELITKEKSL